MSLLCPQTPRSRSYDAGLIEPLPFSVTGETRVSCPQTPRELPQTPRSGSYDAGLTSRLRFLRNHLPGGRWIGGVVAVGKRVARHGHQNLIPNLRQAAIAQGLSGCPTQIVGTPIRRIGAGAKSAKAGIGFWRFRDH